MKAGKLLALLGAMALSLGFGAQPAQAAGDPIKIGVYLPLTGQNAFGGQLELEGVQLAQKEMPEVLGRPVELVVVDNKSDKVEAANAVKRLIERDKCVALIGTYGSSLAMAGAFRNSRSLLSRRLIAQGRVISRFSLMLSVTEKPGISMNS